MLPQGAKFEKGMCALCPWFNSLLYFAALTQAPTTPTTPTTTTTRAPTTRAPTTKPPPPTKPTPFRPCDLNCYDTKRDCEGYDKTLCRDPAYIKFFKSNCQEYCGFCTVRPSCEITHHKYSMFDRQFAYCHCRVNT